ncbi:unnamed protein product [Effrenium voratum]|nr:unnamed protein product [Effrenium voratum]
MAFCTRAMPTPFLPLVMTTDFHQGASCVGLAMSVYPLGAFLATPLAAVQAQRTCRILRLHSFTLIFMSMTSMLMALSPQVHRLAGPEAVFLVMTFFRFAQGVSQAYYMAANTTLISRRFTEVAYTVGMVEVAVGSGAQLGRIGGGSLFGLAGFACPFAACSLGLLTCAVIGFGFEDEPCDHVESDESESAISWKTFCTSRIFVPVAGVFAAYMVTGLLDATLPQHLELHLGLSVFEISCFSSLRSLVYLMVSWTCAQMLRGTASLELMLCVGFVLATLGLMLAAPQSWVTDAEEYALGTRPRALAWGDQLASLIMTSAGNALLFVPGLPLMQNEVRHLGAGAAEKVSSLLMAAMSGGEFFGPIVGGVLVQHLDFGGATAIFAVLLLPFVGLSYVAHKSVFWARPSLSQLEGLLTRQVSFAEESQDLATNLSIPMDPESAYRFRRLAFLGTEMHSRIHSVPTQRRAFISCKDGSATAPSTFRRNFEAGKASPGESARLSTRLPGQMPGRAAHWTGEERGLTIPRITGELATAAAALQLNQAEAAFQYTRTQRGEVDSARLLLVFGLVPAARHLDPGTLHLFEQDRNGSEKGSVMPQSAKLRYPDGSTPLHMAATFGLTDSLRSLLLAGADLQATATSGVQAIHAAAIAGHAEIVRVLVEHKANIDARHSFAQNTPLHFAAEMGHVQVVRMLCQLGADVEAEKSQGGSALHTAADTDNAEVARVLLESCGADPEALLLGDTVPLYLAAGRGFPAVLDVLMAAGADPDRTLRSRKKIGVGKVPEGALPGSSPQAPGWEESNGATALHNACENGHLAAVTSLLEAGARQLATMQGVTPLITALQYRHPHVAVALLDARTPANVGVVSPLDGQSALHIAAAYSYASIVARIVLQGAATDLRDRAGNTPLDYARGEVRWLLHRFYGRDPRLDTIVRSELQNTKKALSQIYDAEVDDAKKKVYLRHLALAEDTGQLAAEVARLAKRAKESDVQHFNVARFLLAGSDLPIALEAMLQRTEMSMTVGLVLLGLRPKEVVYKPKSQVLQVDGKHLFFRVELLLKTATEEDADAASVQELAQAILEFDELDSPHLEL